MYRYNTTRAPRSADRRSTRSARESSTRRRSTGGSSRASNGGSGSSRSGGLKRKFEAAAQRPATKWTQVWRSPASNISFQVLKWVPFSALTEKERLDFLEAKRGKEIDVKIQQQPDQDTQDSDHVGAPPTKYPIEHDGDVTMPDQVVDTTNSPMESAAFGGEERASKKLRITFEVVPKAQSTMAVTVPPDQVPTISQPTHPPQQQF